MLFAQMNFKADIRKKISSLKLCVQVNSVFLYTQMLWWTIYIFETEKGMKEYFANSKIKKTKKRAENKLKNLVVFNNNNNNEKNVRSSDSWTATAARAAAKAAPANCCNWRAAGVAAALTAPPAAAPPRTETRTTKTSRWRKNYWTTAIPPRTRPNRRPRGSGRSRPAEGRRGRPTVDCTSARPTTTACCTRTSSEGYNEHSILFSEFKRIFYF